MIFIRRVTSEHNCITTVTSIQETWIQEELEYESFRSDADVSHFVQQRLSDATVS